MAIKTYVSAGVYDDHLGLTTLGSSSVSVTTSGAVSTGFTAPNLVNKATGVWLACTVVPASGNFIVELLESGVVKASATINNADIVTGFIYARFATPYQFATLTASAYTVRVKNSAVNSGSLRQSGATTLLYQVTYDTATTLGATDDAWIGGFNDSGLTPKTWTISGTGTSFGSGADTSLPTTWATGWGLMVGKGGSVVFDNTASASMTVRGGIGVYKGGLFDMRANASDITKVSTLIMDCNAGDGNYALTSPGSGLGGQILTTGMTVNTVNKYASGTGTSADPVITQTDHGFRLNDEVVFGGASDYLKNETRYVKSIPATNQLVLSTTIGGAEAALTQTHAAGSYIGSMTRNSVIKSLTSTRGFSILSISTDVSPVSDFSYTRCEYPNCLSGRALQFGSGVQNSTFDGLVLYNNSAAGRASINWAGSTPQTVSNVILYNTRGANYSAQSGLTFAAALNKTIDGLYHFADPSSTTNCAMLSIQSTSVNNTINNAHSYGANASNGGAGYSIGVFGSGNTFNNCTVNAARIQGVILYQAVLNTFNNCNFGTIATNTIDVKVDTTTLVRAIFSGCSFGSATTVSQYLLGLEGTEVALFEMDGNTAKHRWYNNHGSFWSSGAGLTDTTVRTPGSLALAIKPEDNTNGIYWEFLIPAVPSSQCGIFGYAYRNANFSAGTFKVELFLPGSTVADASYTFATTTGSWLPFNISAYYGGSTSRYATVRITAVTATAGAYAFIDDLYDAGTGNKVAGLDLWYQGKPSPVMVATDTSAIPAQVWGYSDQSTTSNTMGKRQVEAAEDADVAANR